MNEDMFGFQDENDEDLEVIRKMGGNDVSSGGSNGGGSGGSGSFLKRPRQKCKTRVNLNLIEKWQNDKLSL